MTRAADIRDFNGHCCVQCRQISVLSARFCHGCGAKLARPALPLRRPPAACVSWRWDKGDVLELESLDFVTSVRTGLKDHTNGSSRRVPDVGDLDITVVNQNRPLPMPFWPAPEQGNTVVSKRPIKRPRRPPRPSKPSA